VGLEESMELWQRGEALAAHCATWLDAAEARVSAGE
jgi:exodeoxyribonuclease VII small subunit